MIRKESRTSVCVCHVWMSCMLCMDVFCIGSCCCCCVAAAAAVCVCVFCLCADGGSLADTLPLRRTTSVVGRRFSPVTSTLLIPTALYLSEILFCLGGSVHITSLARRAYHARTT